MADDADDVFSEPHRSVLLREVIDFLQPRGGVGFRALDATLGAAGHSAALLEQSHPDGTLVGFDADPAALALARHRLAPFGDRVTLLQRNFSQLDAWDGEPFDAIVMDLGLSSMQLDTSGRGFSFRGDEPLDMRFDPDHQDTTAADIVNTWTEAELVDILQRYGEEPRARRVARVIVQRRARARIERTGDLVAAVTAALGPARGRIHPATRTFQAARIAVNDELTVLERGLAGALKNLRPTGRLAVISFHSLEDRIVKWRFRAWADDGQADIVTRKPIVPSEAEAHDNPRARSAKLRVAQRTARGA